MTGQVCLRWRGVLFPARRDSALQVFEPVQHRLDLPDRLILPPKFMHEQLKDQESGPDGLRFQISDALKNVFLPFRKHVIETFLQ